MRSTAIGAGDSKSDSPPLCSGALDDLELELDIVSFFHDGRHVGMMPTATKAIVVRLTLCSGDAISGTIPTAVMFFRTTVVPFMFMVIAVKLTMHIY